MSELDKDFENLVAQINVKLNEAATALKEANALREQADLPSLIYTAWMRETERHDAEQLLEEEFSESDPDHLNPISDDEWEARIDSIIEEKRAVFEGIDVSALEQELDVAGWSTSSSYC